MKIIAKAHSCPLTHLRELMEAALPGISVTVDPPADTGNGARHLDLTFEGKREVVQWVEGKGFGLWDFERTYTEDPSAFYPVESTIALRDKLVDKLAKRSPAHS